MTSICYTFWVAACGVGSMREILSRGFPSRMFKSQGYCPIHMQNTFLSPLRGLRCSRIRFSVLASLSDLGNTKDFIRLIVLKCYREYLPVNGVKLYSRGVKDEM